LAARKTVRSFVVRDLETWNEFLKICEREGVSGSEKLEDWIQTYVQRHRKGNPQTLLPGYLQESPQKGPCPNYDRGWCPEVPKLCVHKRRFLCRLGL